MRIQTFKEHNGIVVPFHGIYKYNEPIESRPGVIAISFCYDGGLHNAAHLHVTATEARTMAELLLVNAHRLSPL